MTRARMGGIGSFVRCRALSCVLYKRVLTCATLWAIVRHDAAKITLAAAHPIWTYTFIRDSVAAHTLTIFLHRQPQTLASGTDVKIMVSRASPAIGDQGRNHGREQASDRPTRLKQLKGAKILIIGSEAKISDSEDKTVASRSADFDILVSRSWLERSRCEWLMPVLNYKAESKNFCTMGSRQIFWPRHQLRPKVSSWLEGRG